MVQTTTNPADVVLDDDETVTDVDFGDFRLISISGTKFNDLGDDGVRDPGDTGLAGVTVFLDTNDDGTLDPGEMTATTDINGNFTFANLGPGTYIVREVPPVGSTQTTADPAEITVSSGTDVTGVNFANFQLISISGTKFNDLNGDGLVVADSGQAGVTVFLDTNANGTLDPGELSTMSDINGNFTFGNLGPGTYRIREVQVAGSTQTTINPTDITVSSDTDVTGVLFGNFQLISISGTKFQDTDGSGTQNAGELGLAGFTIFLDAK